jgi:hypothetical protein
MLMQRASDSDPLSNNLALALNLAALNDSAEAIVLTLAGGISITSAQGGAHFTGLARTRYPIAAAVWQKVYNAYWSCAACRGNQGDYFGL